MKKLNLKPFFSQLISEKKKMIYFNYLISQISKNITLCNFGKLFFKLTIKFINMLLFMEYSFFIKILDEIGFVKNLN